MTAVVDREKCTACGECVPSCPLGAIVVGGDRESRAIVDSEICGDCGVCIDICPASAISLD